MVLAKKKAIVLIGFQNDYFSKDGILYGVVEESLNTLKVLENTVKLIKKTADSVLIISTPIIFTEDYSELIDPVGILATIKKEGAFMEGTDGASTIDEIDQFKDSIIEIPGKQGLNAFINTNLEQVLRDNGIEEVILVGCVCSICIDSTGRSAAERGFSVTMLSDCISARTMFEHKFYIENVFPLYAKVTDSNAFIKEVP